MHIAYASVRLKGKQDYTKWCLPLCSVNVAKVAFCAIVNIAMCKRTVLQSWILCAVNYLVTCAAISCTVHCCTAMDTCSANCTHLHRVNFALVWTALICTGLLCTKSFALMASQQPFSGLHSFAPGLYFLKPVFSVNNSFIWSQISVTP